METVNTDTGPLRNTAVSSLFEIVVGLKGEGNDEIIAFAYEILQKKITDNAFLMEENVYINAAFGDLILKKGEKGRVHCILQRWDHVLQAQL